MRHTILLLILIIGFTSTVKAQVGINNTNPDTTSVMDLKSTTKGFLIPRMSSSERNIMTSFGNVPANSLMVFDTDKKKFFFYDANVSKWLMINPWYSEESAIICYGDTVKSYAINIRPIGGYKIFKVSSSYNGISSNSSLFQSEFIFTDGGVSTSGVKFNSKVAGGNFILMQAFYNNSPVLTLKHNGNLGLGYSNPTKKLEVDGNIKASSNITADEFIGDGAVAVGTIIMWSGSLLNLPAEWVLCDGNNGTPNLKDKFIMGAGGSYAVGNTGGANEVTLTEAQLPVHDHSGNTSSDGQHRHYVARNQEKNGGGTSLAFKQTTNNGWHDYDLYRHSSNANRGNSSYSGGHSHTLSVNDTGGGQAHENKPPYYSLAYIMRIN